MSLHAASIRCRRRLVRDDSPQKRGLAGAGVPQAGSDRQQRHHGRHHDQPELQRPARPAQQFARTRAISFPEFRPQFILSDEGRPPRGGSWDTAGSRNQFQEAIPLQQGFSEGWPEPLQRSHLAFKQRKDLGATTSRTSRPTPEHLHTQRVLGRGEGQQGGSDQARRSRHPGRQRHGVNGEQGEDQQWK